MPTVMRHAFSTLAYEEIRGEYVGEMRKLDRAGNEAW
jgi:hypothetical protein